MSLKSPTTRFSGATFQKREKVKTWIFNQGWFTKENIGIWEIFSSREEIQYHTILDEIMTTSEFEKRQQHGLHRVAYIDSTQVMDQTNDFSTCFPYENIKDYYNGDDAGMIGGKGAVWKLVSELDRSSFAENETGYLTSRFIINCNGEAGNFLFEEAGLDYNRKAFSPKTKEAISVMLKGVQNWKPLEIDGERKDAYTYITFKFRDGEIVEILP